jgi:hypothetical protein
MFNGADLGVGQLSISERPARTFMLVERDDYFGPIRAVYIGNDGRMVD